MMLPAQPDPAFEAMRDWMQHWSDAEARLSSVLLAPKEAVRFSADLQQAEDQALALLQTDADATLYWLFQLAASSSVGYSTSHALLCWALCRLVAPALTMPSDQQRAVAMAALTMNMAMTVLQDELARQTAPPNPVQRRQIDTHAAEAARLLGAVGVTDALWLDTVAQHHHPAPTERTARLLQAVDRYAAMISPRQTRPGQCVTDSDRHALLSQGSGFGEVGHVLIKTVGVCPPGTFVRLEDERTAIVLRRSGRLAEPWAASVLQANGLPVAEPELIDTSADGLGITAALITQTVRVRLNHTRLLQLSRIALAP